MAKGRTLEKLFSEYAELAGFIVEQPRPIRIDFPVLNRFGELTKKVTLPDSFVIDPVSNSGVHIEVRNGKGTNKHKEAQQRVVNAAGVKDYYVFDRREIDSFSKLSINEVRAFILNKCNFPLR